MTDPRDVDPRDVRAEDEIALSGLLDAELDEPEAARLRARLPAEPALAARLAELAATDAEVAALAGERPSEARLGTLRSSLATRLAAEPVARPRRPVAWLTAAGAALAAGLTLYLVSGAGPATRDPGTPRVHPVARARPPESAVEPAPRALQARREEAPNEGALRDPSGDPSEADLAIALEYDVLADFEVIENLALLEALAARDAGETM